MARWLPVLLLPLLGACGAEPRGPRPEVFHEGRSFDSWLEALGSPFLETRRSAVQALRTLAPAVSLELVSPEKASSAIARVTEALRDPDEQVRAGAATALGAMKGQASAPALLEVMRKDASWEARSSAAATLSEFAKQSDDEVRTTLLTCAGMAPALELRAECLQQAARLGPEGGVLPVLITTLESPEPRLRQAASLALRRLGARAAGASERLVQELAGQDHTLADVHARTLSALGAPAVESLRKALASDDAQARRLAAEALGRMGPEAGAAVADLAARLGDQDSKVRRTAAEALGRLGPVAAAALPDLEGVLRNETQAAVVNHAALALVRVAPTAAAAGALLRALKEPSWGLRARAARAAAWLRPAPAELVAALSAALQDPVARVRRCAAVALQQLEAPSAPAELPHFSWDPPPPLEDLASAAEALAEPDAAAHRAVAEALTGARFADGARSSLLCQLLVVPDPGARRKALRTLLAEPRLIGQWDPWLRELFWVAGHEVHPENRALHEQVMALLGKEQAR